MAISDTSPAAAAVQLAAQRRLTGEQRVKIALEMSLAMRDLALAGLRHQHPDWPDAALRRELLRRLFPADRLPAPLR
jgi:hypothetical protein